MYHQYYLASHFNKTHIKLFYNRVYENPVSYSILCHPSSLEDIFLDGEEGTFFSPQEDKVIEETIALLKRKSQNDTGHNYKLGETERLQRDSQVTLIYTDFSFPYFQFLLQIQVCMHGKCLMYCVVNIPSLLKLRSNFIFSRSKQKITVTNDCTTRLQYSL